MITDFISKKGNYIVRFEDFNGSGWNSDVLKIIEEKIKPQKIEKNIIEISWDNSEIDFSIEKDNINFIAHLDDSGPNSFKLVSKITEESKQKLREWATIIATEIEKLR